MLSSTTEMKKVIEAARNKSVASLMPSSIAQAALPAVVPAVLLGAVSGIPRKLDSIERERSREGDERRARERKYRYAIKNVIEVIEVYIQNQIQCMRTRVYKL